MKRTERLQQLFTLLACVLVLLAAAIQRDGKVLGHQLRPVAPAAKAESGIDTLTTLPDGSVQLNTAALGKGREGYGGQVPLVITMKDGKITAIASPRNAETPSFFERAAVLFDRWVGKTPAEALAEPVDAVSGATFTSNAIIDNLQRGMAFVQSQSPDAQRKLPFSWKLLASLVVVLLAAVVPLITKSKPLRTIQLLLNVGVLGLWAGTFLDYTLFMRYAANGFTDWSALVPILMLVVAFIFPLFGKKSHYCLHVCPLGSAQELMGRCSKQKLKMGQTTVKVLTYFRQLLWAALMLLMLAGVWFEWMDYELFTAFIFQSASVVVIALALLMLVLAIFIPRPYCRFVCPTGTLFKVAQNSK